MTKVLRPGRSRARAALAVVPLVPLVLLAAGCATPTTPSTPGGATTGASTPSAPTPAEPLPGDGGGTDGAGTALRVDVDLTGDGDVTTWELTCDPAGGTHPDPDAACAAVRVAWPEAFEPVGPDVACTEVYGGPQTARVLGTVDGAPVDAAFSRTNGCEIGRWNAVVDLLGTAGGL